MVSKKRLIYAEDLFNPVDFTVFQVGRRGGKTMAMYEQLFRKRVELAPTVDAVEVVRCKDCKDSKLPAVLTQKYGEPGTLTCHNWHSPCNKRNVKQDDFCSYGERRT